MTPKPGVTTGNSPSERLERKSAVHYALAQGLRKQGHEEAALGAFGRAQEFHSAAERARRWESNRFDRTGR